MKHEVNEHRSGTLQGRRICLITSGNPGSNPRLVKEANALCSAGAEVMVIAELTSLNPVLLQRTADVRQNAAWHFREVRSIGLQGKLFRRTGKFLGRLLHALGIRTRPVVNLCYDPLIPALARKARQWPADLYIAHNLAALPAAYQAAASHAAKLGFDAEDFHSGQFRAADADTFLARLTAGIELEYLPRCHYVTAASPGIARAYAQLCGIPVPAVILNVFPLSQAPASPRDDHRATEHPALYWFSQTIGQGRGLETVADAVCKANCRPRLYLQGTLLPEYRELLRARLGEALHAERVRYLDPGLPEQLIRESAVFDAGIASELSSEELNRDIALSNKIFSYMLAGLALIASDTSAQRELAGENDEAILLYPQGDAVALAALIDTLFSSRERLMAQREKSLELGRYKYNWDLEQAVFLQVIKTCLAAGQGT